MPSLIDFRRRIRSVKNTQQITKAMKMVSASKLRRAQDRVIAARPYARSLSNLLSNLVAAARNLNAELDPLLEIREEKRIALVLITSDRGLAGAYNANLAKFTARYMTENPGPSYQVEAFGRKGRDYFRKRNYDVSGEYVGRLEKATFADAKELAERLIQRYRDGEIDAVYMVYSEFKSVLSQTPTVSKVLPVTAPDGHEPKDYLYEQPPQQLLAHLLPLYVEVQIFRGLLEANTGQHAARMTAMDAASKNCSEVIDKLTLEMNRIRQASITKEIIEVVSGAQSV
jgi:F-type H+-transporting ATPase subunit gamma